MARRPQCDRGAYPAGAWNACVFDGTDSGSNALLQSESWSQIDQSWGGGGPAGRADNFSLELRGTFSFAAGRYRFHASADDGVRVDVGADGSQEIDDWSDHPPRQVDSAPIELSGDVPIVVR